MPNPRRALFLTVALVSLAACSSTTSRSSDSNTTDGTTTSSLAGDTATTATGDTSATTAAGDTTLPPTTVAATNPPATNPPATNPPATNPPPTGPQVVSYSIKLSGPCPPPPTTGSPDASFHPVTSAPPPDPVVKVSWKATGADSVYVAIDNRDGPYTVGLPVQGSMDLPYGCGSGAHKYYVVAVKGADYATGQKDYKSQTING